MDEASSQLLMRSITRWRSLFNGMASMSLTAEGLIRSLYLATLTQIFQDFLKRQVGLVLALLEGGQIFHIFSQTSFTARLTRSNLTGPFRGLEPQSLECKVRISEIDVALFCEVFINIVSFINAKTSRRHCLLSCLQNLLCSVLQILLCQVFAQEPGRRLVLRGRGWA
jgi:hypothetical protein